MRMFLLKFADNFSQQANVSNFAGADADSTAEIGFLIFKVVFSFFYQFNNVGSALYKKTAGRRKGKLMLAAVKKSDAQIFFQLHQLPA